MTDGFVLSLAAVFAVFLAVELVLTTRRSRELKEAQRFLNLAKRETFETAQVSLGNPYPLIQLSDKGRIIFINPAAFERFPGIMEQGFRHPVLAGLEGVIGKSEAASRDVEYGEFVYNQMITPARVNGQAAVTIYCYDVTDRKAYEKKLRESREDAEKARREAEAANQARGDFLANMSHELRTPMNGIIGLSDILVEAGLKPEQQELIEAVNSSAHNLLILLNDILDFSKIEAGELTLESIPFDLRRIVRQIEALQKPVAARKGLVMSSEIGETVPQRLVGDPSRLQQILNNLIGNALKFTEEGAVTLSVGGEADGQGRFITRLSVADTGIGIPPEQQDKLFKKFQQADASTSRKYGGTGLGLAICKTLAELMGGDIALHSEAGKGTTFTVTIPVDIAEAGGAEEEEGETGTATVRIDRTAKILVVDDHPINLLFMRRTLENIGLRTFDEAASGQQAIDLFKKNRYDLILMDCQMPEMDGYEASRQIRGIESGGRNPVIVAVTANAMKGTEDKCRESGMDDYVSKPVDKEKLKLVLQRWLPGCEAAEDDARPVQIQPIKIVNEPQESPAVFDWDHLYEYTSGDRETEDMLVNMFLENLETDLASLQKCFAEKNLTGWESMAHKLHGASAHMGAWALAAICDQAQSLPAGEVEAMKDLHQRIVSESQRLQGFLEKGRKAA